MIEETYQKLKKFFVPFVMERYRSPNVNEEFRRIIEDIAKSFLWCILSVSGKLHLQAISTITVAEATLGVEQLVPLIPSEIHNWLLFLQNNGKLVGTYDRFTGIYSSE
ncbi:MAG: hypothetical protein ACTSQF_07045 [Candidatus Heimdallarchaeaceae archaeon]